MMHDLFTGPLHTVPAAAAIERDRALQRAVRRLIRRLRACGAPGVRTPPPSQPSGEPSDASAHVGHLSAGAPGR
ncbi:MAG: hypothetical protein OXU20_35710 [Myxococcales bacterium]|nr:hypothetical protein [Myxococcales bacterium]MDD9965783.1 hypothetical protein [Myxococcales bacterium]